MAKVLVLLSGGCESTALLEHAKQKGHDVIAMHVLFSETSLQEVDSCKEFCKYYDVPLYFPSIENKSFNNKHHKRAIPYDIISWILIAASSAIRAQDIAEVWYGACFNDDLTTIGKLDTLWKLLRDVSDKPINTVIRSPLYKFSKIEQYASIPIEIRKHVVYCWKDRKNPCGECNKCNEWKEQGLTKHG